jgi:GTP-binding protein HflX
VPHPSRGGGAPAIHIHGNTQGLKASQVRALERLYRRRLPPERILTQEFARSLTEISHETRRQVGVLVDRGGEVTHVMVGDAGGIEQPDWGRLRAGRGRLRGLRCIHTTVGGEDLSLDDLTDLACLRLDAMVTVSFDEAGIPRLAHVATLKPEGEGDEGGDGIERLPALPPSQLDRDFRDWMRDLEAELGRTRSGRKVGEGERAILVSVQCRARRPRRPADGNGQGRSQGNGAARDARDDAEREPDARSEAEANLAELRDLARSAGVTVVDSIVQHRDQPDPKTHLGSGRLRELMIRAFQKDVDLVIFDANLTPSQARNLANRMELRVIDRTQLILDIFAQRASSADGKLQVELAQLKYRLPRLAQREDISLSRLGAGIGGRGPGETKLEVDRRRVRDRITRLERELQNLRKQRNSRRQRRRRQGLPVLSIVGYTNAGKSTLLRALTKTDVHVEDRLFATLDPASRRLRFPHDRDVIITDTVGFIRDLPPDLTEAFRATLEELSEADLFLHVVDAAAPDPERRMAAVWRVLDEMSLRETPELLVLNQVDRLPPGAGEALAERLGGVAVSALTGQGLERLLERAAEELFREERTEHGRRRVAAITAGGETA